MRIFLAVAAVLLAGATGACTQPALPLTSSTLVMHFSNGSLPPPYHFSWTITLPPDGPGTLAYAAGYTTPAGRSFAVDPARRAALVAAMEAAGVPTRRWRAEEPPLVGGSSSGIEVRSAGRTLVIPGALPRDDEERLAPVRAAFSDAVPEEVWRSAKAEGSKAAPR